MSERCDRARQWASLGLDGELSELERSLLDAHLARCPECARVVGEVRAVALRMRAEPLVQPALPVVLPRRRTRARAFQIGVAAATVAVGISLGTLAGSLSHPRTSATAAQQADFSRALVAMLRSNAPHADHNVVIPI